MPIDAAVTLFDGQQGDGPAGLREGLLRYSPQFVSMFVEKLMTYALGRGIELDDKPLVRTVVRQAAARDYRWSAIVLGIVRSAPFQMKKAPASAPVPDARQVANGTRG